MATAGGQVSSPRFIRIGHLTLAKTWKEFERRDMTIHDLVEVVGIHPVTAGEWCRALNKQRCIHIVGWQKDSRGRDVTAVYRFGEGFDRPKSRMTPAQRQAAYKERQRALKV